MIRIKVTGNPYEMGFQCGKELQKQHAFYKHVLELSEERIAYAKECVPIYKTYAPEILDELKGMADALEVNYELLAAFTLGMYAYTVDTHCSCLACTSDQGIFLGRNSDFLKAIKDICLHVQYGGDYGYHFIGNTTSFIQMEDGMNEHGFAVGLTFVYPIVKKAGFNAGLLVRYLLEHCKNVEEAIQQLQILPIGSAQTLTMADASGNIAVVECNCEQVSVKRNDRVVYAVNHFSIEAMGKYNGPHRLDDLFSDVRYETLNHAFSLRQPFNLSFVQEILRGDHGFLCQYDAAIPADTVWSTIYDVLNKRIYLCEGNPSREILVLEKVLI